MSGSERLRAMEISLRQHVVAFFSGGVLTAARVAAGFVRVKYLALALGTSGVGVLSQASQTQLLLVSVGSLAMARGLITRMGAHEATANPEGEARLLATALTVMLTTSLVLVAGIGMGSNQIVELLFPGGSMTNMMILPVLLSVPFSVVATGYAEGVLMGAHRYDLYIRSALVTTLVGAVATIVAVYFWGLQGGIFGILGTSLVHCAVALIYALRIRTRRRLFRFGIDRSEAVALVKFSAVMLAVAAAGYVSRLWIQSRVIGTLGVDANGLLHVPLALTSYYTPLLTNPLWGRLHPAVSRTGETVAGRRELAVALEFTIALATLVVVTVLPLKEVLVETAYSAEFLPAAGLLPLQLLGDYFYFIALTFGVYSMGVGRLRIYLTSWVGYYLVSAVVATFLLPTLGLQAVAAGYGVSAVLLAVPSLIWLWAGRSVPRRGVIVAFGAGTMLVFAQAALAFTGTHRLLQAAIVLVAGAGCAYYLVFRPDSPWRLGSRAVPEAPASGSPN